MIYSEYKKRQAVGEAVDENVLQELAGNVPLSNLDESIVMSALNGRFEKPDLRKNDNSMLDISSMVMMPDKSRKGRVERITESSAKSSNAKKGQYTRILQGLKPVGEEDEDGKRTDPDLMGSARSGKVIQDAQKAIRKNSGFENEHLRKSKTGTVASELDQIVEDVSQEQSRVMNSNDIDQASPTQSNNQDMAGGNVLAGIFEQSAAAQNKKRRQF